MKQKPTIELCVLVHWFAVLCDDECVHPLQALHDACEQVHPSHGTISCPPNPPKMVFADMDNLAHAFRDEPVYVFRFGAYGWRCAATQARSIYDALEQCAAVLPQGLFYEPEYGPGIEESNENIEAIADLLVLFSLLVGAHWVDQSADAWRQEHAEECESDLTYTESGYLASWEWGISLGGVSSWDAVRWYLEQC